MFEVRFKDIDPDTGSISQDKRVCECEDYQEAFWVQKSLESQWFSSEGAQDPNREFYIKKNGEAN
jgi:hypothetical protein